MRIEWSEAVRSRNWDNFVQWAKKDPSQALANCISAVESSIGEKHARRQLRKALFLLKQQGFEPLEEEESEAEAAGHGSLETHRAYLGTVAQGWL